MIIQLNADKNLTIHEEYQTQITAKINKEIERFDHLITRIEVHLSDENGIKNGQQDKRCLLEARIEGRSPVAVTHMGQNYDLAINGAVDKLKSALNTIVGKLQDSNHSQ